MSITISCALDTDLAARLCDHLLHTLALGSKESVSLKDDEIYMDITKSRLDRDALVKSIDQFLKSMPTSHHELVELDDILTIGTPTNSRELMDNLFGCEMCNYLTPYEEQLRLHRMTHGNVLIG